MGRAIRSWTAAVAPLWRALPIRLGTLQNRPRRRTSTSSVERLRRAQSSRLRELGRVALRSRVSLYRRWACPLMGRWGNSLAQLTGCASSCAEGCEPLPARKDDQGFGITIGVPGVAGVADAAATMKQIVKNRTAGFLAKMTCQCAICLLNRYRLLDDGLSARYVFHAAPPLSLLFPSCRLSSCVIRVRCSQN
jgi:hypothetical protein